MSLKIYNTATRKKETFQPIHEGQVGIYVCGITAYDVCHVGHARAAIVFDVVVRYLKASGWRVTFVKNFTDIDDKIIDRAKREGVPFTAISERYIQAHDEEMAALGVEPPTVTPRATEHMAEMIALVKTLEEKGYAYDVDGDVYFSIRDFQRYGKLSGRNLEEMMAGARVDVNDKKRNPLDFALWKKSKEGEPFWESPWGRGRPGWHIECSAMSARYLGTPFDIHGGGEDLIFPHHENEVAQTMAATGRPLANYWMHNGFVRIHSEKMSKSLGNIFPVREILKNYHPEVLRLFILQNHYRSPVDYSDSALNETRSALLRVYTALKLVKDVLQKTSVDNSRSDSEPSSREEKFGEGFGDLADKFNAAMDDDFNTAQALGYVFETVRRINHIGADKHMSPPEKARKLSAARGVMDYFASVLGVFHSDADAFFLSDRDKELRKQGLNAADIEALVEQRNAARAAKDWATADAIRAQLAQHHIVLKDAAGQTSWMIE